MPWHGLSVRIGARGSEVSERRPKVLLVAAATATTGGGERHVADLMRGLPDAGFELELLAPSGGDINELAASLGIRSHAAEIAGMSLAGLSATRRAIAGSDPDIVHAHGSRAAFYARLGDPHARERVVYTLHGIHADKAGPWLRRRLLTRAERVLAARTRRFVCVCIANARSGAALGILDPARTSVVYNGIALVERVASGRFRSELGIGAVPLALSVGRYSEPKDHPTLLRAWALVRHRMPDAVLALIGGGQLEAATRALADSLGLGGSVRFCATRPDLRSAYTDADVVVLSSLWEGLPYVVLEALANGTPVVSTAVDGIPEAVMHGETGLLVPPSAPEPLAAALVELLSDRGRSRVMGEMGRADVAERFSLEGMIDGLADVYRGVLGERPL